jgi:hypothetical protein
MHPRRALEARCRWRTDDDAKLPACYRGEQLGFPETELGRHGGILHEQSEFTTLMTDDMTLARERRGHLCAESALYGREAGRAGEDVREASAGAARAALGRTEKFVAAADRIPVVGQ